MKDKIFSQPLGPASVRSLAESTVTKPTFFKQNPIAQAVVDKLVRPINPMGRTGYGYRDIGTPAADFSHKLVQMTANNVNDFESLMQLLPDTKMAMNILVSSIISPNDMIGNELHFHVDDCDLPAELTAEMLSVISDYFKRDYKIEQDMVKILQEMLFKKGAYPLIIVPESSLDEIINSPSQIGLESLNVVLDSSGSFKQKGILGPSVKPDNSARTHNPSLESFGLENVSQNIDINVDKNTNTVVVKHNNVELVKVTDNVDVLKSPSVRQRILSDRADFLLNNGNGISTRALEEQLYRRRNYGAKPTVMVNTVDKNARPTIGHPMVIRPPVESVIPVHVPGDPSDHIGYFILLDNTGNPVNQAEYLNYYSELTVNTNSARDQISQLIQSTKVNAQGISNNVVNQMDKEAMVRTYSELIESDLMSRLKNGIYGDNVAIKGSEEVYRVMFARALQSMQTQLLYVPRSLVTYMAFDYNMWGVGKSLLEDSKILGGIRAMLLFAQTMAEVKNSVGHEVVEIQLDPEDVDPARTVEFLMHEVAKNRQTRYPLGTTRPVDMISYLQNAGIQFAISGHQAYPETRLNINGMATQRTEVNSDLAERLKKQHLTAWGVPPESVDASADAEFATTVVRNNILFSKTVTNYQDIFVPLLTDHILKYTINSSILVDKLKAIIAKNRDKLVDSNFKAEKEDNLISMFLMAFKVSLPRPDTVKLEKQMEAYDTYKRALDEALDNILNTEALGDGVMGELAGMVENLKKFITSTYRRRWLTENNVVSEINELTTWDENSKGFNLLEQYESLTEGLRKSLLPLVKAMAKAKEKSDEALQATGGIDSDATTGSDNSNGGSDLDSDLGGGDDFGDFDDLGAGDETDLGGGDEETKDDQNPGEPGSENPEDSENKI